MNWTGAQGGEGFEFHLLAIAIGIAIMIRGAGALSVDRAIEQSLAADSRVRVGMPSHPEPSRG